MRCLYLWHLVSIPPLEGSLGNLSFATCLGFRVFGAGGFGMTSAESSSSIAASLRRQSAEDPASLELFHVLHMVVAINRGPPM